MAEEIIVELDGSRSTTRGKSSPGARRKMARIGDTEGLKQAEVLFRTRTGSVSKTPRFKRSMD